MLQTKAYFQASGALPKLSRYVACALLALPLVSNAAVYVATGPGSFYDKPIQFKDHPSDTDYVCASSNAAGVWTSSMGRPCDYFLWANIPSTQSIATCDTSSGTCKNQNGGIETYVVKASISGSTPTPPVVTPPPPSATADELVTWSACALTTTKDICVPIGYHVRWFGPQTGEAILGNVLTYTIKGLSNGFYSVTVASIDATGEGSTTNAAHFTINAGSFYHVKAISGGTRPATEAVLPTTGTALVLGYKLGDIAVGKPCADAAIIKSGSTEYHAVGESDTVLLSPTYKGRLIVAVCGK